MQVSKARKGYKLVDAGFGKEVEIPEEWEVEEFKNLVFFQEGPGLRNWQFKKSGMKIINVKNLQNGKLNLSNTERHLSMDEFKKIYSHFAIKEGDIVVASSGATYGKVAIVSKKDLPIMLNTSVIRFFPKNNKLEQDFLKQFLESKNFKNQIDFQITGSAQPNFGPYHLNKMKIFRPMIGEQKKIASILSNIDDTLEKINQLIEKIEILKKGLMQKLFTKGIGHTKFKKVVWNDRKKIEIPEEWEIKKLEEIADVSRGKFGHRPRNDPDYYGGKHPFIQTGDIEKAEVFIKNYSQTLNEKGLAVSKYFSTNTIVINIAANIGGTAITTFPICFPDSIIGISSKIMDIRFLEYYLRTQKKFLENVAHTSAQKNINYDNLKPLLTPYPSIDEQKQIASILSNVDSQISKEKLNKSNLEILKKGLMQKLLTGQIRVKV